MIAELTRSPTFNVDPARFKPPLTFLPPSTWKTRKNMHGNLVVQHIFLLNVSVIHVKYDINDNKCLIINLFTYTNRY